MGNAQLARRVPLHRLVPGRTYHWSVQAVDGGFAGSAFAAEGSFVFNPPNNPPVVVHPIADLDVYPQASGVVMEVIDLRSVFQDPETPAADLTYAIQSDTKPAVVAATLDPATGRLTLAYQSGSTGSATLTVRATDTGGCFAQVSFNVTVNTAPQDVPVITAQPQDQAALIGTDVTLSVTASDALPLSYQWYQGGTNSAALKGKTQATLLIPKAHATNSGPYWVAVKN